MTLNIFHVDIQFKTAQIINRLMSISRTLNATKSDTLLTAAWARKMNFVRHGKCTHSKKQTFKTYESPDQFLKN